MLEVTLKEIDQSSNEEMCGKYAEALTSPKFEKDRNTPHISEDEGSIHEEDENTLLTNIVSGVYLSSFTGPKMYIKVWFCPLEFNPY